MKFITEFLDLIYPAVCKICGSNLDESRKACICQACWDKIKLIKPPYCCKCGIPMESHSFFYNNNNNALCSECKLGRLNFVDKVRSIAVFEGSMRGIIHLFKYKSKLALAHYISELTIDRIIDNEEFTGVIKDNECIIPVPLYKRKKREREYNQAEVIAKGINRYLGKQYLSNCLFRRKNTISQSNLDKKQRMLNVKNVFAVYSNGEIAGKKILLIDDVFTTGATINECAKVLLEAGALKVRALTIACAVLD